MKVKRQMSEHATRGEVHNKHLIYRTSDETEEFRGTCIFCGATDMSYEESKDECPNPKRLTYREGIALSGDRLHVQRMNND
jgi:hypothetical protein